MVQHSISLFFRIHTRSINIILNWPKFLYTKRSTLIFLNFNTYYCTIARVLYTIWYEITTAVYGYIFFFCFKSKTFQLIFKGVLNNIYEFGNRHHFCTMNKRYVQILLTKLNTYFRLLVDCTMMYTWYIFICIINRYLNKKI